jgi:hypothetical protein
MLDSMLVWLLVGALLALPSAADEPSHPRFLVTGDSMVEPMDGLLAHRLKRAGGRVKRDPRPGTGVTKPELLDWVRYAKKQARRFRPAATVVFLGANDSAPLRSADGSEAQCCRRAWIDAYADRLERMMRSYRRGGKGRAYWVTLPLPRDKANRPRFLATNYAIAQAAEAVGDGVRVVDTIPVLSPGGHYRRKVHGKVVHDKDGVHLSRAGSAMVRDLVIRAMRADGVI